MIGNELAVKAFPLLWMFIILLLLGGDKSSQSRDIEKARQIAAKMKEL